MKKRVISIFLSMAAALGLLLAAMPGVHAYSASGSISIESRDLYNVGDTITVTMTINSDYSFDVEGTIQLSGGLQLVSGVTGTSADGGTNPSFWAMGLPAGGWNGTFKVKIVGEGDQTVGFTTLCSSKNPAELTAEARPSATKSFHVQTADEEAYRRQQESIAEESRRKEAEEAERRRQEEERIRQEEERRRQEEAERQAQINASIAESIRVEQSIKESIYNQSMSSYWAQSAIEKSLSIEASLADLTRAYEIDGTFFVPYTIESAAALPGGFLFAVEDTELYTPEEYMQKELVINNQNILAYQSPSMAGNIYLVFGRFSEEEEPAFYFYNTKTGYFFPYDLLYGEVTEPETESETETETETSTEEETTETSAEETTVETAAESVQPTTAEDDGFRAYVSGWDLLTIGGLGIFAGACLTGLIAVLARRKREKALEDAEDAAAAAEAGAETGAENEAGTEDTAGDAGEDTEDAGEDAEDAGPKTGAEEDIDDSIFEKEIDELL